jgi:lariat debranching enzyme
MKQAVRNGIDLNCMSVPAKYRRLGDFHKYYSGEAKAPVLTLVIGGNHEASNYFFELYYGGWLAPNIYYLGAAGVIRVGPWRIAGLSGIYDAADYGKGHFERLPYKKSDIRSVYHVRSCNVGKLMRLGTSVDIGLSHDWPAYIEPFGDYEALFRRKPHFLESAKIDNLGSKAAVEVLNQLRPSYWFSGHMHDKFAATVRYKGDRLENALLDLDMDPTIRNVLPAFRRENSLGNDTRFKKPHGRRDKTEFLALDKPSAPGHMFLEVMQLELPPRCDAEVYSSKGRDDKLSLHYDAEWLAIVKAFSEDLRIQDRKTRTIPEANKANFQDITGKIAKARAWVDENIVSNGRLVVPNNFERHAPIHTPGDEDQFTMPKEYPNKQTADLAKLLNMENVFEFRRN